ncbi:17-beta-hydroxysteroid dehydrogenase 14-like [Lethenteron reissneri]|uniref:17-beta-hydroxysteroid dehydrogenase 14-like n=1 Tax=Lethenteron reissneri TaxID=7753 RepID=UPI002AB62A99|nr:17-beta-hydroxysteroid dehydrogenase 14-like [Lethenteron reissneri]XP_061407981.1 17-beta-hydroxysteroid dehydrogenase 14-like [Lethenteron reissneri]
MEPGAQSSLRYRDKVAIITGGTTGIGQGTVRVFVSQGAKVVFCAKDVGAGNDLEAELNSMGPGEAFYVACDVTKEEQIKNLIDVTVQKYGRIDCLVNNAGVHPPPQKTDDVTAEDFTSLLNLNLVSYFLASKYALPHLRKTEGNIVNVASLVAVIGQNDAVPYVATKGAITAMTKAMAVDESRYNVRVNSISPGNIWTPMWQEFANGTDNPEATVKGGENAQLLGRMGTTEESGKVALFLAADATFCTGIDLLLTAGAELNYARKNQREPRSSNYD